jgi:hypothetical protein
MPFLFCNQKQGKWQRGGEKTNLVRESLNKSPIYPDERMLYRRFLPPHAA